MGETQRKKNWVDRARPLLRIGNRWEVAQLRRLGTSGMTLMRRSPVLVVESTGRKTGRLRATPVAYWSGPAGAFFVAGGAAGMTRVPDWVANLRANPLAAVVVSRRRIPVRAEELTGEPYNEARTHAISLWPGVAKYEQMSRRRVPCFRLTPTADNDGA
jgi:deazaflavin-dependent oxidoreductase (nitroreductase family)